MRILREDTIDTYKTLSIMEVNEIDITPVYNVGNPIPIAVFLEFDGENVAEYPMDGTEETFRDAITSYNTLMKTLLITGYCSLTDFGAEIL